MNELGGIYGRSLHKNKVHAHTIAQGYTVHAFIEYMSGGQYAYIA